MLEGSTVREEGFSKESRAQGGRLTNAALCPCGPRGGHLGEPTGPLPLPAAGRRSHRLLRWPPFFFFFFLGGGDAELLDQCLVLGEKGRGVGRR